MIPLLVVLESTPWTTFRRAPGIFLDLAYSPDDHFGAHQAHMLKMTCEDRGDHDGYFVTEHAFAESF